MKGFCRFGSGCFNMHPEEYCQIYAQYGRCSKGRRCEFLHPKKDCKYWIRGFCRKSADECSFLHDPQKGKSLPYPKKPFHISNAPENLNNSFLDQSLERRIVLEIHKVINRIRSKPLPNKFLDGPPQQTTNQTTYNKESVGKNFLGIHPTKWNHRL